MFWLISGLGEQNNVLGLMPGNFPGPEPPSTPGAFASGMLRNEGTIPGVGAAMPLSIPSLDSSSQAEQKTSMPVSMPLGAPPLPPGPHPSLLASNQQQTYQQNMQQAQQPQSLPQQMTSLPLQPSNLPQLQPPHIPIMPHPHLPRPPHQLQQVNMPGLQSSMPGSGPIQGMPIPGPMVSIIFLRFSVYCMYLFFFPSRCVCLDHHLLSASLSKVHLLNKWK